jgi:hypothetical protein
MRDRVLIFAGLLLFVALVTYPMWHAVWARTTDAAPAIKLPTNAKDCVAPLEYMRSSHQKLLMDWREGAVRDGKLTYHAYDGKTYRVSLSQTCLGQCHTSKAEFCDRCHKYAAVSGPYCWDCHLDASAVAGRAR